AAGAVSPNGRIDAVWNDTRNGSLNVCQLFYAYSWDGGGDARPDTLPAAIVGRADAALDLPHTPVPDAPPPMLPPTALGACARATWTVRWRPPVLHVPCPRCQARLRLPLWKVLCYEDVFCEECALRLRRSTPAEPMHPRS
ncbi:MAG TPA: hypothetical protein VFP65_15145, partial [Anaeromyxobacteraceae bacterium]|nr:hypothetical protein [Anaeromyxobacteraceae bacterium]